MTWRSQKPFSILYSRKAIVIAAFENGRKVLQTFSGSLMRDQLHSSEVGFQIRLPTSVQHFVKKDIAAYTGFPFHCYSKAANARKNGFVRQMWSQGDSCCPLVVAANSGTCWGFVLVNAERKERSTVGKTLPRVMVVRSSSWDFGASRTCCMRCSFAEVSGV